MSRFTRALSGINNFFNRMADVPIEISVPLNNNDSNIAREAEKHRINKDLMNK